MCFSPSDDNPLLACGFHSQIPETDSQSVLYLGSHTSRSSNTTTRIIFPGHPFFNHVDPFLRILHLLKIKLKIPRLSFSSPVLTPQKYPPAADLIQSLVFTRLGFPWDQHLRIEGKRGEQDWVEGDAGVNQTPLPIPQGVWNLTDLSHPELEWLALYILTSINHCLWDTHGRRWLRK